MLESLVKMHYVCKLSLFIVADFEAKLKANFEIEGSTASVSLFGPKSEDRTVENVDKPALEATKK